MHLCCSFILSPATFYQSSNLKMSTCHRLQLYWQSHIYSILISTLSTLAKHVSILFNESFALITTCIFSFSYFIFYKYAEIYLIILFIYYFYHVSFHHFPVILNILPSLNTTLSFYFYTIQWLDACEMAWTWRGHDQLWFSDSPYVALIWHIFQVSPFFNSDGPENCMTCVTVTEHGH